jgi:hypothetical protein
VADQTQPEAPHFKTAQYSGPQGGSNCGLCGQPLGAAYYRVSGNVACEACAMRARAAEPVDRRSAFARAIIFGVGAAILGLILYSAFTIATGIEIGFAWLAVGYLIGKGMKIGSRQAGGQRYQTAAVLLTYAAVSLSAVPITIATSIKHRQTSPAVQRNTQTGDQSSATLGDQTAGDQTNTPSEKPSFAYVIGTLLFVGLASPFLELQNPASGAIGLFILFVGMRFAWQLTAGHEAGAVIGPFRNQTRSSP